MFFVVVVFVVLVGDNNKCIYVVDIWMNRIEQTSSRIVGRQADDAM